MVVAVTTDVMEDPSYGFSEVESVEMSLYYIPVYRGAWRAETRGHGCLDTAF